MARVVTALKAHNTLNRLSEPINDFAFALIAPLSSNYYNVFTHFIYVFSYVEGML
jgi:hypothetical protein